MTWDIHALRSLLSVVLTGKTQGKTMKNLGENMNDVVLKSIDIWLKDERYMSETPRVP
jgi:6-phosphogluconolactonase/glucosamine-6-phosphate isomerase/deaminase